MKNNNLATQDRREGSGLKPAMRILGRISRFFTDRYFYREQPGLFPELAAFAILTVAAIVWPIASLATVLARLR
jgi:hypothetical protein